MKINVNSSAMVKHTARLQQMPRSALPLAIRNTLNNAAFDVKKNTMPASAKKAFTERDKNFMKANSKVDMAKGLEIKNMKAEVGFVSQGGTNRAVDDLEQQEYGGNIGGRTFIPLPAARTGRSWKRKPRRDARISDIRGKIVDSADATGKNAAEKFIKSCIHAGKGGWVIGDRTTQGGNRILYQVRSIVDGGRGTGKKRQYHKGDTIVKVVPMFAVQPQNTVKVAPVKFMRLASMRTAKKIPGFFAKNAEQQINKLRK